MNFHSDQWIMERVQEHYNEALEYFPEDRIVCLILQGSQNYGLDYEGSDIDTKLIVTPTFKEIAMNKKAVSTTHIRANDEHIDFKDIRLYIQTFRKQNLNFLEILFSPYVVINPMYAEQWNRLVERREEIARYNLVQAIKSMRGIAKEKYFAMEHHYPSRMEWINKFDYDPKQLHHLLRVEEYIYRYINGELYSLCLHPRKPFYLKDVKRGCHSLGDARVIADSAIKHIDEMCEKFLKTCSTEVNVEIDELLDDVQYKIMEIAIKKEIGS
ncbi:MAG: nucleotidyltransferase domain-containing protein [Clostridia bacterium]|nr:nucleotidyltransferase domain-containing protein [Clostridia bacterium]